MQSEYAKKIASYGVCRIIYNYRALGISDADIAAVLGWRIGRVRRRAAVARRWTLAQFRTIVTTQPRLSFTHFVILAGIANNSARQRFLGQTIANGWTTTQLRNAIPRRVTAPVAPPTVTPATPATPAIAPAPQVAAQESAPVMAATADDVSLEYRLMMVEAQCRDMQRTIVGLQEESALQRDHIARLTSAVSHARQREMAAYHAVAVHGLTLPTGDSTPARRPSPNPQQGPRPEVAHP